LLTSACHQLSSGNTGHVVPGTRLAAKAGAADNAAIANAAIILMLFNLDSADESPVAKL